MVVADLISLNESFYMGASSEIDILAMACHVNERFRTTEQASGRGFCSALVIVVSCYLVFALCFAVHSTGLSHLTRANDWNPGSRFTHLTARGNGRPLMCRTGAPSVGRGRCPCQRCWGTPAGRGARGLCRSCSRLGLVEAGRMCRQGPFLQMRRHVSPGLLSTASPHRPVPAANAGRE